MTKPIPEGFNSVVPYLAVDDAKKAIEFYKRAFGATEEGIMEGPDGSIAHCQLRIGDTVVMLSDPFPQGSLKTPKELKGTAIGLFMYVEDTDEAIQTAADAGAEITMPAEDQFWGDRFGQVRDPFGHIWQIATRIEELSTDELRRRSEEFAASMAAQS